MRLYLDDDLAQPLLATLLRQGGHDVQLPRDAETSGNADAVHMTHAIRQGRGLISGNYKDFEDLHYLILAARGHHPGIFIVRRDNDPRRDPSPRVIVTSLNKLLASGAPVEDSFYILNQWR
jgi:hypothetical protein